jgi:hypothetical protein
MVTMRSLALILIVSSTAFADDDPRVVHVPPAAVTANEPCVITAHIDHPTRAFEVRWRRDGDGDDAWQSAPLRLVKGTEYTAELADVRPPGFAYYIVDDAGRERFASASDPHHVAVREDRQSVQRERAIEHVHGRRNRAELSADYVDFGARADGPDRYYQLDADFTFRVFRFPLDQLRFGFSQLVGLVPGCNNAGCDSGYKVGGWSEIRFRLDELVALNLGGMFAATPSGFSPGGRVELRIGPDPGSHVAIGGELIGEVGGRAYVRLGWDTVPRFPMATTVELTNFPANGRFALRLVYDVAAEISGGFSLGVRVGWQARDQQAGGLSGGIYASLDL